MSSNKYVLQTDGSILRTTFNEDGTSITESIKAVDATKDQNSKFDTFESLRDLQGIKVTKQLNLPFGTLKSDRTDAIRSKGIHV